MVLQTIHTENVETIHNVQCIGNLVLKKHAGFIIESVDSICRDSANTQYMLIQTNFSKSPKQLTYEPL